MKKKRESKEGTKERTRGKGKKEEGKKEEGKKEKKRGETERWQVPSGTVAPQLYPAQDSQLPVSFSVSAPPASSEVTENKRKNYSHPLRQS